MCYDCIIRKGEVGGKVKEVLGALYMEPGEPSAKTQCHGSGDT